MEFFEVKTNRKVGKDDLNAWMEIMIAAIVAMNITIHTLLSIIYSVCCERTHEDSGIAIGACPLGSEKRRCMP
jgi:hypothetical protein